MTKVEKIIMTVLVLIFLISVSLFVDMFNFEGTKEDFYFSMGFIAGSDLNMLISKSIFVILSLVFMSIYLYIQFKKIFKSRGYVRAAGLARISILLLIVYIVALTTTTVGNIGPMLFGLILSFWLFEVSNKS